MNDLFRPYLRKFVLVFFDDILVYSKTWEEHLVHLQTVLTILAENIIFQGSEMYLWSHTDRIFRPHYLSTWRRCRLRKDQGSPWMASFYYRQRCWELPRVSRLLSKVHSPFRRYRSTINLFIDQNTISLDPSNRCCLQSTQGSLDYRPCPCTSSLYSTIHHWVRCKLNRNWCGAYSKQPTHCLL